MARVSVKLDTRKNCIKKNGKYPLILMLSHKSKSSRISLKYALNIDDWDAENNTVMNVENHKYITAKIQAQYSKAAMFLLNHQIEVSEMDIVELKEVIKLQIYQNPSTSPALKKKYLFKQLNSHSIIAFSNGKLERLRKANKIGYVKAISLGLGAIKRFAGKDDLSFSEIDLVFLKNFTAYCQGRGNKPNTISAYLRPVKTLFREAVQEGIIENEINPFPKFKMPRSKATKKRALRIETIKKIRELELKKGSAIWDARNYFLFMFNNMGINLIDVAKLKKSQIKEAIYKSGKLISGRMEYTRSKNGRQYSIKLTSESILILNLYSIAEKKGEESVFPIGYSESEKGFSRYSTQRNRINRRIRKLAEMIKLDEPITSYYARHSWATIAKRKMIPISVIAEGLGHSDLKTTQIYLDSFDDDVLDDANDSIVS